MVMSRQTDRQTSRRTANVFIFLISYCSVITLYFEYKEPRTLSVFWKHLFFVLSYTKKLLLWKKNIWQKNSDRGGRCLNFDIIFRIFACGFTNIRKVQSSVSYVSHCAMSRSSKQCFPEYYYWLLNKFISFQYLLSVHCELSYFFTTRD